VKRSQLDIGAVHTNWFGDWAQRHDMKLLRQTIESIVVERPEPTEEHPQGMCLDKGYDYDEVCTILHEFGFTPHIHVRGEEAKAPKKEVGFKAYRWVVEQTHSWMNCFRRLQSALFSAMVKTVGH
jgi:hypothetical protein